jgi:hypothetical protein
MKFGKFGDECFIHFDVSKTAKCVSIKQIENLSVTKARSLPIHNE